MTTEQPDPTPATPPPATKVELAAGGLSVLVESTGPLAEVQRVALDLMLRLHHDQVGQRVGSGGESPQTAGFSSERPWESQPQMPPELELPHRLNTWGTDGRR